MCVQFVLVVVVGVTRMCSLVLEMVMELDMITNIIYQVHNVVSCVMFAANGYAVVMCVRSPC